MSVTGSNQPHDQWYISMLMQSLTRKLAALEYIRESDGGRAPSLHSLAGRVGR